FPRRRSSPEQRLQQQTLAAGASTLFFLRLSLLSSLSNDFPHHTGNERIPAHRHIAQPVFWFPSALALVSVASSSFTPSEWTVTVGNDLARNIYVNIHRM